MLPLARGTLVGRLCRTRRGLRALEASGGSVVTNSGESKGVVAGGSGVARGAIGELGYQGRNVLIPAMVHDPTEFKGMQVAFDGKGDHLAVPI